jgi:hypothetical protein
VPSKYRTLSIEAAAVCAPLAILAVTHLMMTPPPAPPDASGGATLMPVNTGGGNAPLAPEQAKAAEWIRALPADLSMASPMDHPIPAYVPPAPRVEPQPENTPEPTPEPEPIVPVARPLEGLRLTAVVGNGDGGVAMINGKIYRAGAAVREGITLKSVDVKAGIAHFTLADGTEASLVRIKR